MSAIQSGDVTTSARGRCLAVGDRIIVHCIYGTKHRRRVQVANGSTLTVREWRWHDWFIPATIYRWWKGRK